MEKIILNVNGMHCSGCEKRIENSLKQLKEVGSVTASCEKGTIIIELKASLDKKIIIQKITDLGFTLED